MPYQIQLETTIKATPAQIRSVVLDFPSYNEWNPLIHDPSVLESKANSTNPYNLQAGDKISINFFKFGMKATPEILKNDETEFRWIGVGGAKFVFAGEHYFKFKKVNEGESVLIHGEEFTGVAVGLFKWLKGDETKGNFETLSEQIKVRAEALALAASSKD